MFKHIWDFFHGYFAGVTASYWKTCRLKRRMLVHKKNRRRWGWNQAINLRKNHRRHHRFLIKTAVSKNEVVHARSRKRVFGYVIN